MYNTKEGKWSKTGEYPYPARVTTTAVKRGNDIVVSNGEIKPGVRTPDVVVGKILEYFPKVLFPFAKLNQKMKKIFLLFLLTFSCFSLNVFAQKETVKVACI
ncbi:MAG TPA: hypothetical protein VIQ23_08360, partial [Hanamia sp.]